MSSGVLFTIDEKYKIKFEKIDDFDQALLAENQYFMSEQEISDNPDGYLTDGEHIVIAKMRRKRVLADLAKIGFTPGCPKPQHAFSIVNGQPNVRNTPETYYYEIEHTFEDMGWEYTGNPHADEDYGEDS
ncbi:hypothetical protein [Sessilibacter sp. MAH4]